MLLAGVSVNLVIAWLIVLAGMVHLIIVDHADRAGSLIWRLMIGLAYVFFGAYLIACPLLSVASLALVPPAPDFYWHSRNFFGLAIFALEVLRS